MMMRSGAVLCMDSRAWGDSGSPRAAATACHARR